MKQNYFIGLIACAALTMTGCSNDEINAPQQSQGNNAIEFSTYLGRNAQGSRGTETNDASIKSENGGFGVLAYYTEQKNFADANNNKPNFMWNQKVTYSNSAWSYTPVKYWPTKVGDKVSFFAYAPYVEDGKDKVIELSDNSAIGAPTATITLPDDPSKTIDFVAAVQMNKTHDNSASANNNVSFTLKHEMTRVKVQAKLDKSVYDASPKHKTFVVIKNVTFNNKGQFYKSGIYTFSTDDSKRGTWAAPTTNDLTYTLNLNGVLKTETITAATATDAAATGASANSNYKTGVKGLKLVNTTAKDLFKNSEYLFLIPVSANNEDGLTDGKATATIEYDIVTEDSKLLAGYSCTSATKTVLLPAGTLKQGISYNYIFTIKLDEIVLNAEVKGWDEPASDSNINVPYSPDDATKKN
jgi:hypothetical protein